MATERASTDIAHRRWERLAPVGALGFLLSIVVGALVVGESTPSSQAPAQEIARYYAEHRTGLLFQTFVVAFGTFALYPWFLGSVWRASRQTKGGVGIGAVVGLIGGVGILGPVLVQIAGWGAAALEVGPHRDPSVTAGLMDLGNMGFLLVPFPAAALVLGTSLADRPGSLLPAWLARAGIPLAAIMIVGGFVFAAPFLFAFLGLWMLTVAFVLLRRDRPRKDATEQ